jgi:hypothetical protein
MGTRPVRGALRDFPLLEIRFFKGKSKSQGKKPKKAHLNDCFAGFRAAINCGQYLERKE